MPKRAMFCVYLSESEATRIDQAVKAAHGSSRSAFLRKAALKRAEGILERNRGGETKDES